MSGATITTEVRDHLFLIGLNRPEKFNSFSLQMLGELAAAYDVYEQNADVRCAVLFGHGDHFTTGLDLVEVGPAVAGGDSLFPEGSIDPLDLSPPRRTKPVVCAVHGWCLTIGIELMLACDIRIAAHGTRMRQMEVNRGIMAFGGATMRFPLVAGWGNAMRYLLTGDEIDAAEGLRIGLVQEVVDMGQQLEGAIAIARSVARCAPLAVQATIASARLAVEQGLPTAHQHLLQPARALMGTEDAKEGVESFLERREARFTGR